MELEMKHLVPYLEYRLQFKWENRILILTGLTPNYPCYEGPNIRGIITYSNIKLILRPLSDLTETIIHDGSNIMPLQQIMPLIENHSDVMEKSDAEFKSIVSVLLSSDKILQKFYQYHFDVNNLIPAGLAIDIKSL